MTLIKNNIAAAEIKIDTAQEAEIIGCKLIWNGTTHTIYNYYCPPDKDLSLYRMDIDQEQCIVVGDFNAHSQSWGYDRLDSRGEEVEDWHTIAGLQLLNSPEDTATFYSRRWMTTSTPDLAFCSNGIAGKANRIVQDQLAGSDHRPVVIEFEINSESYSSPLPRWNYKKADWTKFSKLCDQYTSSINCKTKNVNKSVALFNKALIKAANESIPRGSRKDYKPYWSDELSELNEQVTQARETAELYPSIENNISLKAKSAKLRKETLAAVRTSWHEKTSNLNLEKDGTKLWSLAKTLNSESNQSAPIAIEREGNIISQKEMRNALLNQFQSVSNTPISSSRLEDVCKETKTILQNKAQPEDDIMVLPISQHEMNNALTSLKMKQAPGPDDVTNDMLVQLGQGARKKLLQIFNPSWKHGNVPQVWRRAILVPIHKIGKPKNQPSSYRPISLTSCICKLLERIINARLMWFLEKNNILNDGQAGFRSRRSTEDQVTHLAQQIEQGFQNKKHTVAVWIDMDKAFDRVWKKGLLLKLLKTKITHRMFKWIQQYLHNRKAKVKAGGGYSRTASFQQGVPQGGVISPTLFLIFLNDLTKTISPNVKAVLYADDLAILCTEESLILAQGRLQTTLDRLDLWTKDWSMQVNATKTNYTIFSLSTKQQTVKLKIGGQLLKQDKSPTYLGITFDPRLTWRHQVEKAQTKGMQRTALLKKLAGTQWGANADILRKTYTGYVRPTLEYGMAAWGTTAPSNFNSIAKVQNQNLRLITGSLRSTPISAMETETGLQSLEERRDNKILTQFSKFTTLSKHPMYLQVDKPIPECLKRNNFLKSAKTLYAKLNLPPIDRNATLPTYQEYPPWENENNPKIIESIPNIKVKEAMTTKEMEIITTRHIDLNYPSENWIRVYTDGSAEEAVSNGGAGVYIEWPNGTTLEKSFPTGKHSSNYKAEATALEEAADILSSPKSHKQNVVFLTDAKSVLQKLLNAKNKDQSKLKKNLHQLTTTVKRVCLQWVPGHCNLFGNEKADHLAKNGSTLEQLEEGCTYEESKTHIKAAIQKRWKESHPNYNARDPVRWLSRKQQTTIFRLRTGHNRLRHHMFNKLKIGENDLCACGLAPQNTEHVLQSCTLLSDLRTEIWPTNGTLAQKLYGTKQELTCTTDFIEASGLTI